MADGLTTARMIPLRRVYYYRRGRTAAQLVFCHRALDEIRLRIGAARNYEQLRLTRLTRQALNPLKMLACGKDNSRAVNFDRSRMRCHSMICLDYTMDSWIHTICSNTVMS